MDQRGPKGFTSRPVVIYEGLYFDLAQGQMNGAPNARVVQ